MIILCDPGHGGEDPGATTKRNGTSIYEKDINLKAAGYLKLILETHGHEVYMTREDDTYISLEHRVDLVEPLNIDLFASIHCNGYHDPAANGIEIWTHEGETSSDKYATQIWEHITADMPELRKRTDFSDGDPDKEENFYVLRNTPCAAFLLEMGFITNKQDCAWLQQDLFLIKLMGNVANGISGRSV